MSLVTQTLIRRFGINCYIGDADEIVILDHETFGSTYRFNKPKCVFGEYAIIPGYTRYAINQDGSAVIRIRTEEIVPISVSSSGYAQAFLERDADLIPHTSLIHRFILFAWSQ